MKWRNVCFTFVFSLVTAAILSGTGYAAFNNDPYHISLTPRDDDHWYTWYQYNTPDENRDDIARAVDPNCGERFYAVRQHLLRGGRVVLLVGGYGSWGSPSAWERPIATYVNDNLDAVVIQVNYEEIDSAIYSHSFMKGVERVFLTVMKAKSAGAGAIRIYAHSEGADIASRVVAIMASPTDIPVHRRDFWSWWWGQGNPDWFEGAFGFGIPAIAGVNAMATPPTDEYGRRGGFYRYQGWYNGFYYGNKFVLFNRTSDPATYGGVSQVFLSGTSSHDYTGVFSYPDFVKAFEWALIMPTNTFGGSFGDGAYVDRSAGGTYDFTSVHFIPFIPSSSEVGRCRITVSCAPPNNPNPAVSEETWVQLVFYNRDGSYHHQKWIHLSENGSGDVVDPLPEKGGSAIIFSWEQVAVVVSYEREDANRFYAATYPSERYPSTTNYIPFLAKGSNAGRGLRQTTEMVLFNPSSFMGTWAEVIYHNEAGGGGFDTKYYWIPASGSIRLSSTDLPEGWRSSYGTLASAVVRSEGPLCGVVRNRVGIADYDTGKIRGQHEESNYRIFSTRGTAKVYAPYLVAGNGSDTGLVIYNTSPEEVSFRITYYAAGGARVAASESISLSALSHVVFLASSHLRSLGAGSGSFEGNAVIGMDKWETGTLVAVSQVVTPAGIEMHEGIPDGSNWYRKRPEVVEIPLVGSREGVWRSDVNVVNASSAFETVKLWIHDETGDNSGSLQSGIYGNSSVHFTLTGMGPTKLSAAAEGTQQKRPGAGVQNERQGIQKPEVSDFLQGYAAWW